MKTQNVIYKLCGHCGTELKDRQPKFYLPTPISTGKVDRYGAATEPREVCIWCFADHINSMNHSGVTVTPPPKREYWECQRCGALRRSSTYPVVCGVNAGGCGRYSDEYRRRIKDEVPNPEDTSFKKVVQ